MSKEKSGAGKILLTRYKSVTSRTLPGITPSAAFMSPTPAATYMKSRRHHISPYIPPAGFAVSQCWLNIDYLLTHTLITSNNYPALLL
jgi:hypothetical protein